jgi:hypothetical protein
MIFGDGHLFFMATSLRRTLVLNIIIQLLSKRMFNHKLVIFYKNKSF